MSLKTRVNEDMKSAMRSRETVRLAAIRLLMAAIKQREVDDRIELDDTSLVAVIDKMIKQRRDSITQYEAARRTDLAEVEKQEIAVLSDYMPEAASTEEIGTVIAQAISRVNAKDLQDTGKVMAEVKPRLAGRADMAEVSALVKTRLAGG